MALSTLRLPPTPLSRPRLHKCGLRPRCQAAADSLSTAGSKSTSTAGSKSTIAAESTKSASKASAANAAATPKSPFTECYSPRRQCGGASRDDAENYFLSLGLRPDHELLHHQRHHRQHNEERFVFSNKDERGEGGTSDHRDQSAAGASQHHATAQSPVRHHWLSSQQAGEAGTFPVAGSSTARHVQWNIGRIDDRSSYSSSSSSSIGDFSGRSSSSPRSSSSSNSSSNDCSISGSNDPSHQVDADEGNDIALRLPELQEMLALLSRARSEEGGGMAAGGGEARPGTVFLVGTGPGDPDLLTVKALKLLQCADLVLYDRLVSRDVLDLIHDNARLLYVGKTAGYHSRTQDEIHELLLRFAEAGATVVRLKGGDPLVFGRGGEEMDYLQERGVHVEIVPGITSASGICATLGIPLTHRGLANSVRFLTGHSRKGGEDPLYVAGTAADPDSTLVVYMGLATLPKLAHKLVAHGLPPSTPAVAVERGTTAAQRNVFAELADLPQATHDAKLVSPTLIIIGQVVALSHLWTSQQMTTPASATTSLVQPTQTSEDDGPSGRRSNGSNPLLPEAATKQWCVPRGGEPRLRQLRGSDPLLPSQQQRDRQWP